MTTPESVRFQILLFKQPQHIFYSIAASLFLYQRRNARAGTALLITASQPSGNGREYALLLNPSHLLPSLRFVRLTDSLSKTRLQQRRWRSSLDHTEARHCYHRGLRTAGVRGQGSVFPATGFYYNVFHTYQVIFPQILY